MMWRWWPMGAAVFGVSSIGQANTIDHISSISVQDIRQSIISFVNLTTMPGVEGSLLETSQPGRQGELWRSSLGFQAEFTLRDTIANGYWGAAMVAGSLDDEFSIQDDFNDPVNVTLRRDIQALRGSLGLSLPINEQLKIRPYGTLVLSFIQTRSELSGNLFSELPDDLTLESDTESVSGVATLDVEYLHWFGGKKLELLGQANTIYTDTFSLDSDALTTWAWSETLMGRAQLSGDTGWRWGGHRWEWSTYYSHSHYLGQSKNALGFRYVNEVGAGLEWDMHIKPLDWFGWRFIGMRAGYSFGDDVKGFNVGMSVR